MRLFRLGKGSSGTVYKVRHQSGAVAALKVLRPDRPLSVPLVDALGTVSHAALVRYFHYSPAAGAVVMEFCAAGTLAHLWKALAGPPAEVLVAYCMGQLLRALEALHAAGLVHHDVCVVAFFVCFVLLPHSFLPRSLLPPHRKPENILVCSSPEASLKLSDFEEAFFADSPSEVPSLGTPLYAAPECCRHPHKCGAPADVWSAGIVAISLAERATPRARENAYRVPVLIVNEPPPALVDRQHWSRAMFDTVEAGCLLKDQAQRKSATELVVSCWPPSSPPFLRAGTDGETSNARGCRVRPRALHRNWWRWWRLPCSKTWPVKGVARRCTGMLWKQCAKATPRLSMKCCCNQSL